MKNDIKREFANKVKDFVILDVLKECENPLFACYLECIHISRKFSNTFRKTKSPI